MPNGEGETNDNSNHRRNLPPEILADVLSRLPMKPLGQFKCVSPSWNSLISSPYFAQTHFNRINNNSPQKVILISGSHALYSIDFVDPKPAAKRLDFPASVDEWGQIFGSYNGLLLVSDKGNKSNFLLNPITRECKKLPAFTLGSVFHVRGFGYDSSTDDYKVVMLSNRPGSEPEFNGEARFIATNVAVFSLKGDSWRRIQDWHYVPWGFTYGTYFKERLHWLCWRSGGGLEYGSNVVAAFDLSSEVFREVQLPASLGNYDFVCHQMEVLAGCFCLVVRTSGYRNEVWMMKEYGVRESWTKYTIDPLVASQVWMMLAEDDFLLKTKGTTAKWVYGEKLVVYNPEKDTLRDTVVHGIPTMFRYGATYVESLHLS